MIGRIRGTLIEKSAPDVLIDVAGVGYEIQIPMTSFYELPACGSEAILYTHFVVREDAQLLFGFARKSDRALFRELIKANGVGPKLALAIMSGMTTDQFVQCVNFDDVNTLVKLPGVGKKTAERLLIEMRDRLKNLQPSEKADIDSNLVFAPGAPEGLLASDNQSEAISALMALGYKQPQAQKAVKAVYAEGKSSEDMIREALRSMVSA